jgi:tRNA threonylcarbamoyladenosine biosynthesis protein TsaE
MSNDKKLILNSLEETKKIASEIAHKINLISKNTAKIIFLKGDLGTGKTTLVKEILKAYGLSESVTSPTFTIVEPYLIGNKKIYHMDLYRIESRKELEVLGIEEYSNESDSIIFIEWPERGDGFFKECDMEICLNHLNENSRELVLRDYFS